MNTGHFRTPDRKQMHRYRALELKCEGWPREEIAEALNVSKG